MMLRSQSSFQVSRPKIFRPDRLTRSEMMFPDNGLLINPGMPAIDVRVGAPIGTCLGVASIG